MEAAGGTEELEGKRRWRFDGRTRNALVSLEFTLLGLTLGGWSWSYRAAVRMVEFWMFGLGGQPVTRRTSSGCLLTAISVLVLVLLGTGRSHLQHWHCHRPPPGRRRTYSSTYCTSHVASRPLLLLVRIEKRHVPTPPLLLSLVQVLMSGLMCHFLDSGTLL